MSTTRGSGSSRRATLSLPLGALVALLVLGHLLPGGQAQELEGVTRAGARSAGCVHCHVGIEPMHPEAQLDCVDCHGGNGESKEKLEAHVQPLASVATDERVAPPDEDLGYRRFRNPMDLRVTHLTCAQCHEEEVGRVHTSLHGTTAGHLSDGYYEMGLVKDKGSRYSIFPVPSYAAEAGDVKELVQVPPFRDNLPREELSSHYMDLARKECMQCHLWSEGRAVRGRVGFDGDYRGEGCAACHVPYALDGLSESADRALPKNEPGHPRLHSMTRAPTTSTCTSCHYGDASIGLHFRGLSQLPPGAPGGPEIPGTTDTLLNRNFYLDDPAIAPPDIHHERGMHCIDCHTASDVMGDGVLYGAMEHAVEISCQDCHGTFSEAATLRTARGTPLAHLRRTPDGVVLTSKVDGAEHPVPQAVDVLDEAHAAFNPGAGQAMSKVHDKVECYTCHAGWNVNFLGFHFDRNESLTQLDLLSGLRTPGRVTTQEKVFTTWKSFYAGLNEAGRVAPYLTGFSTMGTVRDRDGKVIVDQALPVTAQGLSGMTMIHHQLHSTRPTARSCVECHRSSQTWGLGSSNFRLGRQLAFVADRRGLEVLVLERGQLAASTPLAKLAMPDLLALEIDGDPLQGHARRVFAAEGGRGVHELDVSDPTAPRRTGFAATFQPQAMDLAGEHLFLADGLGGLRIFDVSRPGRLEPASVVPTFDARDVQVQWPYAYVADGPAGLLIVDVRRPRSPRVVGGTRLSRSRLVQDAASHVRVLFQYSRPVAIEDQPIDERTPARQLCALLDENEGLVLVDVTEPTHPELLFPSPPRGSGSAVRAREGRSYRGLALLSHVDLAEPQGGSRTREGDYAYLLSERRLANGERRSALEVVEVSDPRRPRRVGLVPAGYATEMLVPAAFYNPPFLQTVMFTPGELGVLASDATVSAEPNTLGAISALRSAYVIAVEEFPLDRMLDESGRALKDVSHAGSRWLKLNEIERLLHVPGQILGTLEPDEVPQPLPGATARLTFERLDLDRSGLLEGDELASPVVADPNGDGRVILSELLAVSGLLIGAPSRVATDDEPMFLATRTDDEGDLARLLDGTNPFEFDQDGDRRLTRSETSRAFFAALDLDRDGGLSPAELSRHPGELRQLRYGGAWAARRFEREDPNKDGKISLREFAISDRDWEALDVDRNGLVELGQARNPFLERRGFVGPRTEWPTRQVAFSHLPPTVSVERVLEEFDRSGDGVLTQRELKRRPDLFEELDGNGDGRVEEGELSGRVALVSALGVEVTADSFTIRWDLDGDGRVGERELPPGAALALRRAEAAKDR